ncbi:MAG: sensor histidine kinase [Micromonosporaceae bacterium]
MPDAWRRLSLRTRLTLIGTVGLAVGLGLGGVILVAALKYTLQRTLDEGALRTAGDVAALVDSGQLPDPILTGEGGVVVQVIDSSGRIRAASPGADRLVPVLRGRELDAARGGERFYVPGERAGVSGQLRVVAVPAGPRWDRQTVVVAVPADANQDALRLLRITLWVAFAALLAGQAGLVWWAVGGTLRPVAALRRGAAEISDSAGTAQLPVPDAEDEVHRLAVTLNDMLTRLSASRARQRAFVADAAHELRNPLASLRTQLEVAQRHGADAATLADLLAETQRLGRLVDDLLLLARADDAGPAGAPRAEPVELTELLATTVERLAEPRVPVVVQPGETVVVRGDARQLDRVLANLVDNAVRHAATRVTLAATSDGAYATVTVTDDGPGVPEADRERVFDRFTRLDDARDRDAGGAGLGLAIVRELVRLHHGTVQLRPRPDGLSGTTAEVRLPH